MQKNDGKDLVSKSKDFLNKIWPLTLFFMALTFLSELEYYRELSAYLSYAVSIWRDLLYGIFELPVNLALRLLNLPTIELKHPIPELLFIFSGLFFSFRNYERIYPSFVLEFVERLEGRLNRLSDAGNKFVTAFSIALWLLLALSTLVPFLILSFVLFGNHMISAVFIIIMFTSVPVPHGGEEPKIIIYIKVVTAYVLVVSTVIFISCTFLIITTEVFEMIIPASEKFKAAAEARALNQ